MVVGGKGERKGGREKGERRELKLGWWRRGEKGMVLGGGVLASASIYMFHKDESKCENGCQPAPVQTNLTLPDRMEEI